MMPIPNLYMIGRWQNSMELTNVLFVLCTQDTQQVRSSEIGNGVVDWGPEDGPRLGTIVDQQGQQD